MIGHWLAICLWYALHPYIRRVMNIVLHSNLHSYLRSYVRRTALYHGRLGSHMSGWDTIAHMRSRLHILWCTSSALAGLAKLLADLTTHGS